MTGPELRVSTEMLCVESMSVHACLFYKCDWVCFGDTGLCVCVRVRTCECVCMSVCAVAE